MSKGRLQRIIETCCVEAMDTMEGNKVHAARYLGITRNTLKKYLNSFYQREMLERRRERRRSGRQPSSAGPKHE